MPSWVAGGAVNVAGPVRKRNGPVGGPECITHRSRRPGHILCIGCSPPQPARKGDSHQAEEGDVAIVKQVGQRKVCPRYLTK
jgi:hypothetical protein